MVLLVLNRRINAVNDELHFLVLRHVQSHRVEGLAGMFAKESYLFTVKTQFNL